MVILARDARFARFLGPQPSWTSRDEAEIWGELDPATHLVARVIPRAGRRDVTRRRRLRRRAACRVTIKLKTSVRIARTPVESKCHLLVTAVQQGRAQLFEMSFQDDAVEPLAVESAAHFMELLRRAGTRETGDRYFDSRDGERRDPNEVRRALPRELGN